MRPRRSSAKKPLKTSPAEPQESLAVAPEPPGPRVAGWLHVFYLILVVAPLFHLRMVVLIHQQVAMFFGESGATVLLFAADLMIRVGLSVLGIIVARGLVRGRPRVIRLAKQYLLATFAFAVLSNVVPFFVPMPAVARTVFLLIVWGSTLTCVFWVVIGSAYLRWSKRVKETYRETGVGDGIPAMVGRDNRFWRGVATTVVFVWTLITILMLVNIPNENSLFRELKNSDRWNWENLGHDSNEAAEYALSAPISPAELLATFEDETLFTAIGRVLEMDEFLTTLGNRCQERDQLTIAKLLLDGQRRAVNVIKPSDVAKALIAATEREARRTVKCSDLIEKLPIAQPST